MYKMKDPKIERELTRHDKKIDKEISDGLQRQVDYWQEKIDRAKKITGGLNKTKTLRLVMLPIIERYLRKHKWMPEYYGVLLNNWLHPNRFIKQIDTYDKPYLVNEDKQVELTPASQLNTLGSWYQYTVLK